MSSKWSAQPVISTLANSDFGLFVAGGVSSQITVANLKTLFSSGGGSGTVTSVSGDGTVTTGTITTSGSLSLVPAGSNLVLAGPTSGSPAAPTYRALVAGDFGTTLSPTFSGVNVTGLTASTAVVADASKNLVSSVTTLAELAFVHGVTSNIQTQLNAKGTGNGTVTSISGDGTVTSGTITTSGSLTLANATANSVLGNGTGSPAAPTYLTTLPTMSGANLTTLNASNLSSGTVGTARLGTGSATSSTFLRGDGTWAATNSGTVTSVAFTGDGVIFNPTVTGSPVTSSGTLAPSLLTQTANTLFAGPSSGGALAPTFRALVNADLGTTLTPQHARLGLGQAADSTIPLSVLVSAIGVTSADGLLLTNTTAAAAGAQQESPAINWTGQGWKTTATAASQTVAFRCYMLPVQGTTNPTSLLQWDSSINGGAFANQMTLSNGGVLTVQGSIIGTGTIQVNGGGSLAFAARSLVRSSANGAMSLTNSAGTAPSNLAFSALTLSKTTNYAVAVLDSGTFFNNIGAAGEVDFTLPTPAAGLMYGFFIQTAQVLKIIAGAGATIRAGASVSSTAGNVSASTVGNYIHLIAISATEWYADSIIGTWTFA